MKIQGNLVDVHLRKIYPAEITVSNGRIAAIERRENAPEIYILPGLIDSHIHIESSMITPGAFGYAAVRHGTAGVVSDPHEIANVLGWKGVEFMIRDAAKSPVRFWFGAPSCVPATAFETNGATLSGEDIEKIMGRADIKYLSEMMNFPGVINEDTEIMRKIAAARKYGKPVDGHAPGLSGEKLKKYVLAGISTDHECSSLEEAKEKISLDMKVIIREGSAARNLDSLKYLYKSNPEMVMLCSDDLHPEMLEKGHINKLIARLVSEGFDLFDIIRSATVNPVHHYNLESGLLLKDQSADFILVDDPASMNIKETWIRGEKVFENGRTNFNYKPGKAVNNFNCGFISPEDIKVPATGRMIRIIEAFDGELLTTEIRKVIKDSRLVEAQTEEDILKIVVKNRYTDSPPATGFIRGFGLKKGAFAGSIAHDSHNIVAVGTNDEDIAGAVNEIVRLKGGLSVSVSSRTDSLQLNIGGIMTTRSCEEVAREYGQLNELVRSLGCRMAAPFMTLSFMALLVIPALKISDRGLFDVNKFKPVPLFVEAEGRV